MSAAHTPGPWKALGLLSPFGYVIKYDKKDGVESIAYIQAYDIENDRSEPYGPWSKENQANHDLVLAAPELLSALKTLVNMHHSIDSTEPEVVAARAAIAKATGGEA